MVLVSAFADSFEHFTWIELDDSVRALSLRFQWEEIEWNENKGHPSRHPEMYMQGDAIYLHHLVL